MKNTLAYYYHLYPEIIVYDKHEYSFSIQDYKYHLLEVNRSFDELKEIMILQNTITFKSYFSDIISNIFQQVVTIINHKYYILIKDKIPNRLLTINDILNTNQLNVSIQQYPLLNRSNWQQLWTRKVDYFEYQKKYIKHKYPILYKTLDYYIGLAENAISYIGEVLLQKDEMIPIVISRKRVSVTMDIKEFYCPLNIVLDYRIRDISEYLKSLFYEDLAYEEEIDKIFSKINYSKAEYSLLMGRMLFPSTYFDCYEKIINDTIAENKIIDIIEKCEDYVYFLKVIYLKIKKIYQIQRIDWLDK